MLSAPWRKKYWLAALALPLTVYAFEALKISSYEAARAPNVGIITQLILMLGFFVLWVPVPRLIWAIAQLTLTSGHTVRWPLLSGRIVLLGMAASTLHLAVLTFLLRFMYSPASWGTPDYFYSFGEVWLGCAGFWVLAYGATAGVVIAYLAPRIAKQLPERRFEVRQNGNLMSVPLGDIIWIRATGNYSEITTKRGIFSVRKSLMKVESQLPNTFLRSHRSALVNGRWVQGIRALEHGRSYTVKLEDGHEAPLSRRRLAAFRQWLRMIDGKPKAGSSG
jgi:LytTr DNA-binding domain